MGQMIPQKYISLYSRECEYGPRMCSPQKRIPTIRFPHFPACIGFEPRGIITAFEGRNVASTEGPCVGPGFILGSIFVAWELLCF